MTRALKDSFVKLDPRVQIKNPVMFMVYVSAILTLVLFAFALCGVRDAQPAFILSVSVILWLTVLFANFAEAIAEGRGKAQADTLRANRKDVTANKIPSPDKKDKIQHVPSGNLVKGDIVYVRAGEQIPGDGAVDKRQIHNPCNRTDRRGFSSAVVPDTPIDITGLHG